MARKIQSRTKQISLRCSSLLFQCLYWKICLLNHLKSEKLKLYKTTSYLPSKAKDRLYSESLLYQSSRILCPKIISKSTFPSPKCPLKTKQLLWENPLISLKISNKKMPKMILCLRMQIKISSLLSVDGIKREKVPSMLNCKIIFSNNKRVKQRTLQSAHNRQVVSRKRLLK